MTCERSHNTFICWSATPHKLRPAVWMEWDNYLGPTFYYDRHGTREIVDWAKRKHVISAFEEWMESRDVAIIDNAFEEYAGGSITAFQVDSIIQALQRQNERQKARMRDLYKKKLRRKYTDEPDIYPYADTPELIHNCLGHIQDRWNSIGRIQFLLRIAKIGRNLMSESED